MSRPLAGKKILVTRAHPQGEGFVLKLKGLGAEPLHIPLIKFQRCWTDKTEDILTNLHDYSWVFITSFNGVKFFFEWLEEFKVQLPSCLKWAAVGSKTEKALHEYDVQASFVPESYHAQAMQAEFLSKNRNPGKVLFVRGNLSKNVLPEAFSHQGIPFDSLTVYDTLLVKEVKNLGEMLPEMDALTFTSPSTVKAFIEAVDVKSARYVPCFCIGSSTAKAAEAAGFQSIYVPHEFTVDGMIEIIIDYFQKEGKLHERP
ncbi:uroporphyrinogen-III synthase [Halobacillus massiliensis]|uniref:uroporphyrinogen-III synthase n=1 Tax=Halobacillus massiliensis TaxID=1926286 RepID=UPI0009E25721|nr:uroporphyrinogen-III synthase [Halobacillus massiliensis]